MDPEPKRQHQQEEKGEDITDVIQTLGFTLIPAKLLNAFIVSAVMHKGKTNRPVAVSRLLAGVGKQTENTPLLRASLLCDVPGEKYDEESLKAIEDEFGSEVRKLVGETSFFVGAIPETEELKEKEKTKAEAYCHDAQLLAVARRVAFLKDLLQSPPEGWDVQKIQDYCKWSKEIIDCTRGLSVFDDLVLELIGDDKEFEFTDGKKYPVFPLSSTKEEEKEVEAPKEEEEKEKEAPKEEEEKPVEGVVPPTQEMDNPLMDEVPPPPKEE